MSIKKKSIIKYSIIFGLLLIFFTRICPIVPYVGDDWYFVGSMRQPVPLSGIFNPSKVLPEVLQPLCGYVGAYLIYPISHDYVGSLSLSASIIVAFFVTLLCYMFFRVLYNRLKYDFKKSSIYETLFLILFFVIFKKTDGISNYGFWSINFTCYFNYLIPGIVNACIVLYMTSFENFQEKFEQSSYMYKGIFALVIYFSIFSSIQLNIILVSYAFVKFISRYFQIKNEKNTFFERIKNTVKKSWLYLIIILLWLIALKYDTSGMRGKMLSESHWLTVNNFTKTINQLFLTYKFFYKPLAMILIGGIIVLIIYYIKNKTLEGIKYIIMSISLIIINIAYLILLYMNAGAEYASRVDATWGVLFYLIVFVMIVIILCNKLVKYTEILIPIMVVFFSLVSVNFNYPYAQSVYDKNVAKKVDNYIIEQIKIADKKGKSFVQVKVPKHDDSNTNWPQPYNMAVWLQNTLYSHGIIRTRMKIEFVPNKKIYKKFYNKNYSSVYFFDFESSKELK